MAFIVPLVARYTIHETYGARVVNNIIDMHITPNVITTSRAQAVKDQAELLLDAWSDNMLISQVNDVSASKVSWVDLDSATGSTGEVTTGRDEVWPQNGTGISDPMPGNVSVLYQKILTGASRDRRNGRLYLVGTGEDSTAPTDPNNLTAATVTALNTRAANFLAQVTSEGGGPLDYVSKFVVVHILTRDSLGNPLTGDSAEVVSFVVNPRLATQRRRLR